MIAKQATCLALIGVLLSAGGALAHASEHSFVLLLPTEFYTAAGTLAVAASMLLVLAVPTLVLEAVFQSRLPVGQVPAALRRVTRLLSTLSLFALIYVGFAGPDDPQSNLLPLMVWTGLWVVLFVLQGAFLDFWDWLNPWAVLSALPGKYPMKGDGTVWPALAGFAAFQYLLLADIAPSDPDRLAMILLLYTLFTAAAMYLFGGAAWLARGECFTVLFGLIGSLRTIWGGKLGAPGWAAMAQPFDRSRAVFCLVILATGSFDGVKETFWWLAQIGINPLEFPGRSAVIFWSSFGGVLASLLLIASFWGALSIGAQLVRVKTPPLFDAMAVTILPIALGYHFAHYYVNFLVQGQYLLRALGDPFALGWNLFGLAERVVTTGFLNTPATVWNIWFTQAAVVVASHILAVLMAHHLSARFVESRQEKALLQSGLCVLMVLYTIFGLWLLASPRGA